MSLEKHIRKMARSTYWQFLYRQSKEYKDMGLLFENPRNLSSPQMRMLFWLERYSVVYEDMANKESVYLDEEVIDDDYRFDAYIHRKMKLRDKEMEEYRNQKESNKFRKGGKVPEEMHEIKFARGE